MGECGAPGDVADGVDAAIAGGESLVDDDALRLVLDARRCEIKRIDVRPAADRDQQIGALDGFLAVAGQHHLDALAQPAHALDLDATADRDALAGERIAYDAVALLVFVTERLPGVEHGDLGAEPVERLREFEPDAA